MGYVYPGQPRPFDQSARIQFAAGTVNNVLVAAPGAGLCIYVQSFECDNAALAAGAQSSVGIHQTGGGFFGVSILVGVGKVQDFQAFPGGFKIGANTALLADVFTNLANVQVTYTIGPDL